MHKECQVKFFTKTVLTVIAVMFISGCATSPSGRTVVGQPGSPLWNMTADESAKRDYFRGICVQMGIKLDTPEMDVCIKSEPRSASNSRSGSRICRTIPGYRGPTVICN